MRIGPGIHLIHTRIGQAVLIEGPPLTLIDTGARGSENRITRAIRRVGRRPEDLEQIVITHAHQDHIGCVAPLKEMTGAKIFVHAGDQAVASGLQPPYPLVENGLSGAIVKPFRGPLARFNAFTPVEVDGFLEDGQVLDPGIRIIATPGHTPGHVSVALLEGKLLHAGDALFNLTGVRPPLLAATQDELGAYQSIGRLADQGFQRISFGHGPPVFRNARRRIERLARRLVR